MACHYVRQVAERLWCVTVCTDVNVNSAHSRRVAFCSFVSKLSAKFLQALDVFPSEDRCYHLAFFIVGTAYADIPLELPLSALGIPSTPTVITVAVSCIFVATRSEVGGCNPGCGLPGESLGSAGKTGFPGMDWDIWGT